MNFISTVNALAGLAESLDARAEWSKNSRERDTPGTVELMRAASAECKAASAVTRELGYDVCRLAGELKSEGKAYGVAMDNLDHYEKRAAMLEDALREALEIIRVEADSNDAKTTMDRIALVLAWRLQA